MVEVINTTSTALTEGQTIPFSKVTVPVVGNGDGNVVYASNTFTLLNSGLYEVDGDFVLEGTATGDVSVQLYANGNPVEGAVATETVSAVGDKLNLSIRKVVPVRRTQYGTNVRLTFIVSSASTLINGVARVKKACMC